MFIKAAGQAVPLTRFRNKRKGESVGIASGEEQGLPPGGRGTGRKSLMLRPSSLTNNEELQKREAG